MTRRNRTIWIGALLVGMVGHTSNSDATLPDAGKLREEDFFETRIRRVLVEHCYECHSLEADAIKGGLHVDTRKAIRTGGDSGHAVVPSDASSSLIMEPLRYESYEMPPAGRLADDVVADIEFWIDSGAYDPRDEVDPTAAHAHRPEAAKNHWAFQPVKMPNVPLVDRKDLSLNEIDRFILTRLEAASIRPVGLATKRTLLRRVYLTLIGLPPTPDEVDAFVSDDSPFAYEHVVDRLLASPHFGERWGRHWMDVARFAESAGGGANWVFDNAWRYRDWIIRAWNADVPYDQFVMEQLCGDRLKARDKQHKSDLIIATGFLGVGRKELPEYDKEKLEMDVVDEQIDTMGKALLGLSIGCARCHDHKFDPIPIADYYALAGIFESTFSVKHPQRGPHSKWVRSHLPNGDGIAICVKDHKAPPVDSYIRIRGQVDNLGPCIPRGFLSCIPSESLQIDNGSGRVELAQWIANDKNPLTSRVIVNRLWHWIFGKGIVATPDDFGLRGARPTHPKLLDWLAGRFIADNWSLKTAIRRMVLSRTFRLSSEGNEACVAKDFDNDLCWRFARRRLDAETLRDSMLAASGALDRTRFGSTLTFTGRLDEGQEKSTGRNPWRRRSVYLPRYREAKQLDFFSVFNTAHSSMVTGARFHTTIPAQALLLMNSPFVAEQARALAERVASSGDPSVNERIAAAYELALGRSPSVEEIVRDRQFLEEYARTLQASAADESIATWAALCHTILSSNEFLFLE